MPPSIASIRLVHQRLVRPPPTTPRDLLSWLGALQAQDWAGAKWSIGLRAAAASDDAVERAVAAGEIVRSWPLRGTLHLVAAEDLHWMLALNGRRTIARAARRYEGFGLDARTLARSHAVLARAVEGGQQLTRDEANRALTRAGISVEDQRSIHLLQHAALDGLLCFGPRRGKQHTFTSLDEWIPAARRFTPPDPRAELAWRYFRSHGPATLQDFLWWSGLPAADARAGLEAIRPRLVSDTSGGRPALVPADAPAPGRTTASCHLLPGFDEFLVAYKDRSASVEARHLKRLSDGGGILASTMVLRGRVVGLWRRDLSRDTVAVRASPLVPLSASDRRAFAVRARALGRFLGLDATLTFERR